MLSWIIVRVIIVYHLLLLEDVVETTAELNVLSMEVVVDAVERRGLIAGQGVLGEVAGEGGLGVKRENRIPYT